MIESATAPGSGRYDQISPGNHSMAALTSWSLQQRFGCCDGDGGLRIGVLGIGVLGSYGGLNIRDEAFLCCVLSCLRHVSPHAKVVVFSRNEEHTRQHHHGVSEVVGWEHRRRGGRGSRPPQPPMERDGIRHSHASCPAGTATTAAGAARAR